MPSLDNEIWELLLVRANDEIVRQIQERARHLVVYDQNTNQLCDCSYFVCHVVPPAPYIQGPPSPKSNDVFAIDENASDMDDVCHTSERVPVYNGY